MSESAERIKQTMQSAGWPDILTILNEMAQEPLAELHEIMVKKPETLTGKIAIAKANRSRALIDFKAELYDLVKPLNPKGQGQ